MSSLKPRVELDNWKIVPVQTAFILTGHCTGHPRLGSTFVYTSQLLSVNFVDMVAETRNTLYILGKMKGMDIDND